MTKKKFRNRASQEDRRDKQNGAGQNRGKTRPDVASTPENKAATGKRVQRQGIKGKQAFDGKGNEG